MINYPSTPYNCGPVVRICRELYELSGWEYSRAWFDQRSPGFRTTVVTTRRSSVLSTISDTSPQTAAPIAGAERAPCSICTYQRSTRGSTGDAVAKVAIELFEQDILTT